MINMRFTYFLLLVGSIFSCRSHSQDKEKEATFLPLKDSFAVKNLTTFVIDSSLLSGYKSFHQIKIPQIDSAMHPVDFPRDLGDVVYLYSWQEKDSELIEFTTILDTDEHGLGIWYFVFDKQNRIVSTTEVAGLGFEPGFRYETLSTFKSKDTLSVIHTASTDLDMRGEAPYPKLSRRKGDSTFYDIIFLQNGKTLQTKIREKKELNL